MGDEHVTDHRSGPPDEAMSAAPLPPDPHEADAGRKRAPAADPAVHPAEAAREIPVTSGGESTDPDLAELPERAAPSIAASRFEIGLGPESADVDVDADPDADARHHG